jgi:uncharacterized protein (TIGR00369 family)
MSASVLLDDLDRAIAASPYLSFLGVAATEQAGAAVLVLPGSERHIGNAGRRSVHGGVLAALAEAAGRLHLLALGVAPTVVPVDVTTEFLREAVVADTFAGVEVERLGRRFANVRVELWQADRRRPVALAHATYRLDRGPAGVVR